MDSIYPPSELYTIFTFCRKKEIIFNVLLLVLLAITFVKKKKKKFHKKVYNCFFLSFVPCLETLKIHCTGIFLLKNTSENRSQKYY
jgi:hypothetical protein